MTTDEIKLRIQISDFEHDIQIKELIEGLKTNSAYKALNAQIQKKMENIIEAITQLDLDNWDKLNGTVRDRLLEVQILRNVINTPNQVSQDLEHKRSVLGKLRKQLEDMLVKISRKGAKRLNY